jgi:CheY-like chemotaxis protein
MTKVFQIVVADDDLDDQELVQQAFADAKVKFFITKVYDGIQLLDYLNKRHKYRDNKDPNPNLILLDLNMPLMDGFQALQEIKRTPGLKNIPIFVITTSRASSDKEKALKFGATGFYHKGASSKEVKNIVKEVCFDCFAQ